MWREAYQTIWCRVGDYIHRCDSPPDPVHCFDSTSTWHPTQYQTRAPENRRGLLTNSYGYSLRYVLTGTRHTNLEKPTFTNKYFCRIAELNPSSEERVKKETVLLFTLVTTQGVCRRKRGVISAK